MADVASAKMCSVCGIDCSAMKRAKDANGRYICGVCLERAREAKVAKVGKPVVVQVPGAKAAAVAPPLSKDGVDPILDSLVSQSKALTAKACAECQYPMDQMAVVCTHCGFNTITGKGTRIAVHKAPKEVKESSGETSAVVAASTAVLGGAIGGAVGGAIGAAVWAWVAYTYHVEVGWIAIGVGVASGAGTVAGARGATNWLTAIYATIMAALSIIVGRYFAISMILDDIGLSGAPVGEWFFSTYGFWEVVWAILALPTAFKIGGGIESD
jgi:hypothetical protein